MVNARSLLNIRKNLCFQTFFWGVGLAFLIFIPWMIYSCGYFFYYGDFNVQQIPFYQMIHDSILEGNLGWSYTTDLGANIIGSYSFYNLGSPFFWLTLLFPSEVVPYLMAPLLMLKMGCASLAAYLFLTRYVQEQRYAMIGALLYAFSGFSIYNVFFNHFHEAIITFPLILAALDSFIFDKKKGLFAFSVFAAAFVNYYFFAGQAVFVFLFWLFRIVTGSYKMKFTEFLRMVLEIIVGFLCAGIMIVPSVYAVLQNPRLDSFPHGWGALVYLSEQRYFHIISSFFFPPDTPAYANFTPDSNAKWASVAGWLPMFSMVGVFSFYKLNTHKWLRKFIVILFIMALVPVFNCVFQLFNSAYYARWFYMLTLMLSMATVISLDHEETEYKPALIRTFAITGTIAALIGLMPMDSITDENSDHELGLEKYPDRFWGWVAVAFVALAALTIVLCFRKKRRLFNRILSIVLSVIIVGYGNLLIGIGVVNANYHYDYMAGCALANKGVWQKEFDDIESVRSDFFNEMDNMGMFWQIPTIQAFQSIVPGSVMDYYTSIGVERSVGSRPETKYYGIRSLLSVKYLFDNKTDSKDFRTDLDSYEMPGWSKLTEKNNYDVYKNDFFIPYGFTYDEYVTPEQLDDLYESNRHLLMLKAMVLTKEQGAKYADIIKHHADTSDYVYTRTEYYKDCTERRRMTCSDISFENNRITAHFTAEDKAQLVFFSIPYEDGWSATVNGLPVEIEKVNVGFMAVRVPAGKTSEIVFTYSTPGILLGAFLTGAGVILLTAYMLLWKTPSKRRKVYMDYYEDDTYVPVVDLYSELFEEYEEEEPAAPYVRTRLLPKNEDIEDDDAAELEK